MKNSDKAKLAAIKKLIEHGHRGSEWQEAALLHAVEMVVQEKVGTSAKDIQKLIEDVKHEFR